MDREPDHEMYRELFGIVEAAMCEVVESLDRIEEAVDDRDADKASHEARRTRFWVAGILKTVEATHRRYLPDPPAGSSENTKAGKTKLEARIR